LDKSQLKKDGPETWVEDYGDLLFRFAVFRLRDPETAAELVQEALLAGIKGWENFKGDSAVSTWLVSILKNKIIDYLRKASTKNEILLDDSSSEADPHFNRLGIWNRILSDWGNSPEKVLEDKEFIKAVRDCLPELPENYRNAFSLRVLDDRSADEACKILSTTPSNIGVMVYRARMNMRDCIEINWFKV